VATTAGAGDATAMARDGAARGIDIVIGHGGDGTLNEIANGLAGTRTALAVLRGGTANVWAKEIGVPRKPIAAMRAIVAGERRRIDLGRAGEQHFLLMAGVGFDALIVRRVGSRAKRRLGALAYVLAGFVPLLRQRAWAVEMAVDSLPLGEGAAGLAPAAADPAAESSLFWLLLGNTRSYAGVVQVAHRARADDGLLDAVLMRRGGLRRIIADAARLLLRRHDRSPNVRYARTAALNIETPGLPVQVDGEYLGETPMRFGIAPGALEVIVPAGLRSPLFADT
jgi:YegS/Rv2252/BmrU family lipid kinase